jgi:hypothetical protein
MPRLIIKGTPVAIPDSAQSPNWAPGIIQAFEALTDAVNSVTGAFDVSPQVLNIDANNNSNDVDVNNLNFPASEVRAATVYYSVFRKTQNSGPPDGQELTEAGTLEISYNDARPSTQKWEIVRVYQGEANISFSITDLGQIQFSTTPLTGINHTGTLSYRAISILNDE